MEHQWLITETDIEQGACVCPTTGETYRPLSFKVQHSLNHTFVWLWCGVCDTCRRVKGDAEYDALHPQVHYYELVEERTA